MDSATQRLLSKLDSDLDSDQERLRLILVGSAEWITQTIRQLHSLGFAQVGDWSAIMPMLNSTDLISILTRTRRSSVNFEADQRSFL